MSRTAPYGTWPSALDPELLVASARSLGELQSDGDTLCWYEGRPSEAGRQVVMQRNARGEVTELTPPDTNARTRVHEYGGGAYLVVDGVVFFCDFADQRLYRREPGKDVQPLTPEPGQPAALRYGDLELSPDGDWLLCVRERHEGSAATDVHNEIVAIPVDGSAVNDAGAIVVLASGRDFVSSPKLSADGGRLAYITWDHPNMPWDETELIVTELSWNGGAPTAGALTTVAGGADASESVMAPAWSPDDVLHFISDRTGWWNLYVWTGEANGFDDPSPLGGGEVSGEVLTATGSDGSVRNLAPLEADLGAPAWQLGGSLYDFLDDGRLAVIATSDAVMRPSILDPETGTVTNLPVPHTSCRSIVVSDSTVDFIGGSPTHPDAVVSVEIPPRTNATPVATGGWEALYVSRELPVDERWLSQPEVISFPTSDGMTAHALYHRPRNPDMVGPDDERPPLIVTSHGGPTSHVSPRLELGAAFWTSRGFAVVDVNYRGSTGFGRAYREALRGTWGVYDVDDCVAAAEHLAQRGETDLDRTVIRGGSASGFTTLAALTFRDVFAGGASHYGVADLGALAEETHKFESRYLDRLVGPYPDAIELYRERSPVYHPEGLSCPVILLQGMLDRIVPPAQAEVMVDALAAKGIPYAYVTFEDEDHGFRKAENQLRAITSELSFYGQVFGFEVAGDITPVEVVGLSTKLPTGRER